MVELKNGESFNGHLVDCDTFMNITLREVYQTSAESDRFWKLKEVYIRGSTVGSTPLISRVSIHPTLVDQVSASPTEPSRSSERRTVASTRSRKREYRWSKRCVNDLVGKVNGRKLTLIAGGRGQGRGGTSIPSLMLSEGVLMIVKCSSWCSRGDETSRSWTRLIPSCIVEQNKREQLP